MDPTRIPKKMAIDKKEAVIVLYADLMAVEAR
jgi:hypothetical protein